MKKVIKVIVLVLVCGLIFYFSSRNGGNSQSTSDKLLEKMYPIYSVIGGGRDLYSYMDKYGVVIRKIAHFVEFFLLGSITYLVAEEFFEKQKLPISLAFVFIYACIDEIHQLYVPGRSGQISDVLLDFFAASIAIIILHLTLKKKCEKES